MNFDTAASAEAKPTVRVLRERCPEAVLAVRDDYGDLSILIETSHLVEVAKLLKTHPELDYGYLMDIVAIDREPETPRFEAAYNFYSLSRRHRVRIRVQVPEDDAVVDSLTGLWKGADWFEREAYDMIGIRFRGHPNLTRILTHPDFIGHPLRKDYDADRRHPTTRTYDLFEPAEPVPESPAPAAPTTPAEPSGSAAGDEGETREPGS